MPSFKEFIVSMLSDEVGSISHKRTLSIIGSFVLFITFIFTRNEHLGNLIFCLVCLWGGLATIDKLKN